MLYLANPTGEIAVHQAMRDGKLGFIKTPAQGNALIPGVVWCADNGCFGKGYPGDARWLDWLEGLRELSDTCLFATAPDVVGRARESLARSLPLLSEIRERGFRAALVAQDGMEEIPLPWDEFDALFIGGKKQEREWKLSQAATNLALEARARGKYIHLGRVNSRKRLRFARSIDVDGYDSVDGTFLKYGPRVNLPKLLRWLDEVNGGRA